ncbi:MAG: C45 family autoproteolytic acyltransferase/hydrolase [Candidatus Hydrogenedentes bacterium]|nr:C45 family autoproteolytic acyltransferase/hydrolase [Candidatus Hydrogenedentota bacterium]
MNKQRFAIVLLGICTLLAALPALSQTPPKNNANMETSAAAKQGEAILRSTDESPVERTLPADHWLVGTSHVSDMLPAIIAPETPRKLLAEYGPAYVEQIGSTRVLHLKGSHHDMGFQHGTLLKDEILIGAKLIETVGAVSWDKSFKASSREAWQRTSPFIPQKFKDEIAGMAEAIGLPVEEVQDFTIFPELFHCSGFAVWGKASADGALLHGRVLDYMREVGMDRWALLIIQEPEGANAFVNVGYSGTIGSVTGMNVKVGIGEMGGGGAEKWDGMPMTLLVRECLETGNSLEEVQQIMSNTPRTCEYYYVVSDSKAEGGRGSAVGVASWPDKIQFVHAKEFHELLPRPLEDAVTLSAGDRYQCLVNRVEKMYGKIDVQVALDLMARGVAMSSNMHDALFKPETLELWVTNSTLQDPACNRPYMHYDLKTLMAEKPGK